MDTSKGKDEQTAKILAFLLRCDIIKDCTPEDLSSACVAFSVTPADIRRLCALPNSALRLITDETVGVSQFFSSFIEKLFLNTSFTSLLKSQNYPPNDSAKHGSVPALGNVDGEIVKLGSKQEPTVARSNFDGVNSVNPVTEIRPWISSRVLLPTGYALATNNGSIDYIHEERPSTGFLLTGNGVATNSGSMGYVLGKRPSTALLPTGYELATTNGNIGFIHDERHSTIVLPIGYGLFTNHVSRGYIHGEKPGNPPQRTESHHSAHDGNASKHLQRIEKVHTATPEGILSKSLQRIEKAHTATPEGVLSKSLQRIEKAHTATPEGILSKSLQRIENAHTATPEGVLSKSLQRIERAHTATSGVPSKSLQRIEKAHTATPEGVLSKSLQRVQKAHIATPEEILSKSLQRSENCHLATHNENPSHFLQRPEKFRIATGAARLVEQDLISLANDINAQPKKKSRDPRSAPRFEDYTVDGEVGAGGYGTVYKVRRRADGQVFAMKCPLENTSTACVRNEINMLKRLRDKDNIIQFKSEVIGKVSPTSEAGGGEYIDCPSILLEFIEHDKPEVLKKEITIDELKCYSSSLFKALAQLHRERILHLDVKPGNFLFSRSTKRGCLVDFNLARGDRQWMRIHALWCVSYRLASGRRYHDESAKRLSTRRPERGPSSAGNNKTKSCERKKRPLVQDDELDLEQDDLAKQQDESKLALLPLSKRSRKMIENDPQAAEKLIKFISPSATQSKETSKLAASKVLKFNDNTSAQQLGTDKNQQNVLQGLKPTHWAHKFSKENVSGNPSRPPTPTQIVGVSVKVNPSKRVDAGVHSHQAAQPSSIKRIKPILKVAAVCQPKKDGPCVGTKGYRAPEVLMRSTKQTTKVDIWSAGVSLLQLATGKSPFPSSSTDGALKDIARLRGSTRMDKLAKSLGQRPRFLKVQDSHQGMSVKEWCDKYSRRTDLKGRVPSTLYDLIDRCLDVNPDSRISAEEALQHQFCLVDTSEFSKHINPS